MAKVKTASAGATKKAAFWKSNKTNTPTKVVRGGKVTKPPRRPNIKGESTSSEYSDYLCKYYEVKSQTRLCFVKIKRDTSLFNACINNSSITNAIDSGRSGPSDYNKETSVPETGIHTTDKNAENEINNCQQNLKNIANGENISTTPMDVFENTEESVTASSRNADCVKQSFHNRHKAQATSSVEEHREITITENKTPTAIKKCFVKLYKNPMVSKSTPPAAEEGENRR